MNYVIFPKGQQKDFITRVKEESGLTWEFLAQKIGKSKPMIMFFRQEHSKMSIETYKQLCKIGKSKPKKLPTIQIKNKPLVPRIPKMNQELAEIIGSLAGDGHIGKYNYEVSITGHKILDNQYLTRHMTNLFQEVFGIMLKIRRNQENNAMKVYCNAKQVSGFLCKNFNLPLGKKKYKLHIPQVCKINKVFSIAYLRGLFDTDGSVYCRRKKDIVISFISRDEHFLNEVKQLLQELKYTVSVSGKNLCIYRQEDVFRFMEEIQPANRKHRDRYQRFLTQKGL